MDVIIFPPNISDTGYYVIATREVPYKYATARGNWVGDIFGETAQFRTARDAISFAESRGWTILNKADKNNLIDVP